MRFARLLVACVAFFVARPAAAIPAFDTVILVAGAELAPERPVDQAPAPTKTTRQALHRNASARSVAPLALPRARERAPGTPLVLVPEKYLRNCSLLC